MSERARVRCSTCRCTIPLSVLWATANTCPRCAQPVVLAQATTAEAQAGERTGRFARRPPAVPAPATGR